MNEKPRVLVRTFFLVAGIGFLAFMIYQAHEVVLPFIVNANWLFVTGSVLLFLPYLFITAGLLCRLLNKYEATTTQHSVLIVYLISQLGKYIPGRLWFLAYQRAYLPSGLVSTKAVILANSELMLMGVTSAFFIGAGLLAAMSSLVAGMLIVLVGVVVNYVIGNSRLVYLVTRFRGSAKGEAAQPALKRKSFYPIFYYFAYLFLVVPAILLALDGFAGMSGTQAIAAAGYQSVSWVAGVVAIVVPAGLGIKEAAYVFLGTLMEPGQTTTDHVAVAIVLRFWMILVDVIAVIAGFALAMKNKDK